MGDLNKWFSRSEFACSDNCGADTVDAQLLQILTEIREEFGPVTITSGHRCAAVNKSCGGAEFSQHLLGRAADFVVKDTAPSTVQGFLAARYPTTLGIGSAKTFTHLDTRKDRGRWSYS